MKFNEVQISDRFKTASHPGILRRTEETQYDGERYIAITVVDEGRGEMVFVAGDAECELCNPVAVVELASAKSKPAKGAK